MALEMIDQRDRKKNWISRSIDELIKTAEELEKRPLLGFKERTGFGQYRIKIFVHHPVNNRRARPIYIIEGVSRRDLFQSEESIKTIPIERF